MVMSPFISHLVHFLLFTSLYYRIPLIINGSRCVGTHTATFVRTHHFEFGYFNRFMMKRYEIEQKSKSENVRSLSISFSLCVSEVNRSSTFFFSRRWNSKCVTYQEKSESFDADLMCLVVCESNKSENGRRMAESERDKWKEKSSCNGNCSQKGDWCAFAHQPLIHF